MGTVTLSDQARAVAALEDEKATLFREAGSLGADQADLLRRVVDLGVRHRAVLQRIIAIEDAQKKLVVPW